MVVRASLGYFGFVVFLIQLNYPPSFPSFLFIFSLFRRGFLVDFVGRRLLGPFGLVLRPLMSVTAAVYRGFNSVLAHLLLTFRHRAGVRPYTSSLDFAQPCVFTKQSLPPALCHPPMVAH